MNKKATILILSCASALTGAAFTAETLQTAVADIEHAIAISDATWQKSIKGSETNTYMADTYNMSTGASGGSSDVWPYTAAIEAHCAILEALNKVKDEAPQLYADNYERYIKNLDRLIDNLEYYRGTYQLSSYATSNKEWSPYAVPRASQRGAANVTGILNVYDDQMWLARELVRAYRITHNETYLELATYLTEYVIDGWDCWRDDNGEEYGGITWGPGYNSKHACSNAPIIQPLVWLAEIYDGTGETTDYYYRNERNSPVKETRLRSELYLEFARKIYDWQKTKLLHSSGVYWDMMGADNTIKVSRGYRQHVDCGGPSGNFYSYNTGTMISGAAELYRVTGDDQMKTDVETTVNAAMNTFSKYVRKNATYDFTTDASATSGFNTWFNNVLMRSFVDAAEFETTYTTRGLSSFQKNLDYAYNNHLRDGLLPIKLLDGWGNDTVTKAFHQFTFAAQYAMLAVWALETEERAAIDEVAIDMPVTDSTVYDLRGINLGDFNTIGTDLPAGLYIVGGKKILVK